MFPFLTLKVDRKDGIIFIMDRIFLNESPWHCQINKDPTPTVSKKHVGNTGSIVMTPSGPAPAPALALAVQLSFYSPCCNDAYQPIWMADV